MVNKLNCKSENCINYKILNMEITKLKGVQKEIDSNFNNIIPEKQTNQNQNGGIDSLLWLYCCYASKSNQMEGLKLIRRAYNYILN